MGKERRSRHGLRAIMARVKVSGLSKIDRRTVAARDLIEWKDELLAALGGAENVTPQKAVLVDAIVRGKLYVDHIDSWLMAQRSLMNGRKRAILPALAQRQQLVDGLARLLAAVGLERQARPVKSLHEYLQEKQKEESA